jgi:diguanylate cyclase (GGDEF)-like protein
LTTWYVNFKTGLFIAALSAITWAVADFFAGTDYRQPIIYFWNTLIRLGFFVTVTYLIAELHKSQKTIEVLADTDYVTGAMNARRFNRLLEHELNRSRRYKRPFTLVYLDLDNFKQVNDNFGHNEGDQLIKFIAEELKCQIRSTDAVARLGGDEFALLFPEAGRNEVEVIMFKTQTHLKEKLRQSYPFVTFSAGAVTYEAAPHSTVETIRIADELMYSVKASTKNGICYFLYSG